MINFQTDEQVFRSIPLLDFSPQTGKKSLLFPMINTRRRQYFNIVQEVVWIEKQESDYFNFQTRTKTGNNTFGEFAM